MPKYWPLSMANLRRYVLPDNMADLMAQMRYADPPSIPIMLDGKKVGVAVVHAPMPSRVSWLAGGFSHG